MSPLWALVAVGMSLASARTFVTDGNVVGPGGEWTADYRVLFDGDDNRFQANTYEFDDREDIDEVRMWVDLPSDSLRVAWRMMAPPYPNRLFTDYSGTHDIGTLGILLDADADTLTGTLTDRTRDGLLTFASELIGADFALALTFERVGAEPLLWASTPWALDSLMVPASNPTGCAAFGVTYDRDQLGPNAAWTEGAWSITSIRAAWEPVLQRPLLRRGDLIGVAGLMSTPILFGYTGEEITNGGYFLIGWGPVVRHGGEVLTKALHDTLGNEIVAAGLPVWFDTTTGGFLVDGEMQISPLVPFVYGDASGDGSITAYDASLVLRHTVGVLASIDARRADVSGNGAVTAYDACLVLMRTLEPSFRFPAEALAACRPAGERVGMKLIASAEGQEVRVRTSAPMWAADLVLAATPCGENSFRVSGALASAEHCDGSALRLALVGQKDVPVRLTLSGGAGQKLTILSALVNEQPVDATTHPAPPGAMLFPATPNPFNPSTTIRFELPQAGPVRLTVHALNGQRVRTLVDGTVEAGMHEVVWDGRDAFGRRAASGVYVCRLESGERAIVRAMTLLR